MGVKLFNTLTREKETFKTIEPGKVRMYVCGPTVYNHIHIGNARPFVVFDVVRRYLKYKGYDVKYVQNFTDVDDKLIRAAREEGSTVPEIAERYIDAYFDAVDKLGVHRADVHPRVTENMPDIIESIRQLLDKGVAYESEQHVYFRARSQKDYGKLSHQSPDELKAGARVEVNEAKEDPLDFVLWKPAKPGEIAWDSPWGKGRPGWHIECSVMSRKFLGDTIDIHAGGSDLTFPHHENEIAQSEALTGQKPFARYWLHNGFINMDNEKMSKSLGNVVRVNELLEQFSPLPIRYVLLSAHYRQPLNFSQALIEQAENAVERIHTCAANLKHRLSASRSEKVEPDVERTLQALSEKFEQAMDDDFNTPNAMSVVFKAVREANEFLNRPVVYRESVEAYLAWFDTYAEEILGLLPQDESLLDSDIERLIAERDRARKERDFAKADSIRDHLRQKGIILEDTPQGVRWRRK
ncbi:cysteine--tRNA ligase [Novibacillus thermophilus]|uniref:Cysteine--tRNA ligase n=1 Tax=Novibacillus thermophilus TaxID=1471761 RepID=A0A1U9K397_9BACL|nr:cysteine--tRNA ligase [Novibacillus thermophilus]AQS54508.1 cysteine--tRNA ligase [Novibacillus thermophilus]